MRKVTTFIILMGAFMLLTSEQGCLVSSDGNDRASNGISKKTASVQTDLNGNTIEQNNIINRLKEDNKPGSVKHLYIISAYSGQVIMYSTVKGKVTSGGKRLDATLTSGGYAEHPYVVDNIQDDGTYGSSCEYIYWWDSKGIYHQHYPSGGQIIHISNEPIAVKSVTLNLELNKTE